MTDAQYAWLVAVLGPDAMDRPTADAAYIALGSLKAVALTYVGGQMSEIRSSAMQVSISGAISVTLSENYKAWERMLSWMQGLPDDPSVPDEPDTPDEGILVVASLEPAWQRAGSALYVRRRWVETP